MAGNRAMAVPAALIVLFCAPAVRAARTKITPVQQVLQSLSEMKTKAEASMETEHKTYAQYDEWVDDRTQALGFEMKTGESTIKRLTAFVDQADNKVASLSDKINDLDNDIARLTAEKNDATKVREAEHDKYVKTQQDYSESVDALERAIQTLKVQTADTAQAEMLLQKMSTTKNMRRVLAALALEKAKGNGAPAVAAYKFQGGNILATLENLHDKFKEELDVVESEEAEEAHYYDLQMIHLSDTIKKTTADRNEKAVTKAKTAGASAKAKGEIVDTKRDLAADQALLADMTATFQAKTEVFHENQKVRKDELEAIGKAIELLSSPPVAESYSTHINLVQAGKPTTLLQMRSSKRRVAARQRVAEYLMKRGGALSSRTLTALASKVAENPFGKVIDMIKDLLAKLKEEASAEADHKAWCDEQLKANKLRRNKKTTAVDKLVSEIESTASDIETMGKNIDTAVKDQADLEKAMQEASAQREKESMENKKAIADAQAGAEVVKQALVVLEEFYSAQSSLVQMGAKRQVPEMESYKGLQGSKKGVIGMLEVIRSDFLRLESDTETAEQQASREYDEFTSASKADKKAKHEREVKLRLDKDQAEFEKGELKKDLAANEAELQKANVYYDHLKPTCLEVHVNYAERTAKRKEELAALKEAYKILDAKSSD
mmetsp:Transcript_47420/g.106671  ORF Transcript_47420/g.106671 Transcript_47420/m.106671 type:complete len:665 (-) Transcript_47420:114-2108(-)